MWRFGLVMRDFAWIFDADEVFYGRGDVILFLELDKRM